MGKLTDPRIGHWMQSYAGRKFYPMDPRLDEIDIVDIGHALANICRFTGHVKRFYSVAEHCCHVCDLLPQEHKLAGLLHDASECYLCDLPRPIKRYGEFASIYLAAENSLMTCIARKFDFPFPLHPLVYEADERLLVTEALQLMAPLLPGWDIDTGMALDMALPCWTPGEARTQFMLRYIKLKTGTLR